MTRRARLLPLAAVLALFAAVAAEEPAVRPLTEEWVVRAFIGGTPVEEIIRELSEREVAFDLSDAMVSELTLAGVPGELIEAMRRRQAELTPPPEPEPSAIPGPSPSQFHIELGPGSGKPGAPLELRVAGEVDFLLRERWQLDRALEGKPLEDVAVFLACRTPTHIEDHWRSRSPLGRDFNAPRHRIHAFLAGARHDPRGSRPDLLVLELPPRIEVELDPAEPHDLSLGIAVGIGGQYYVLDESRLEGVVLEPGITRRFAEIRSPRSGALDEVKIAFTTAPEREIKPAH